LRREPRDGPGLARRRQPGLTLTLQVLGPSLVLSGLGLWLLAHPRAWVFLVAEAAALVLLVRLWLLTAGGPLSQTLYEPLDGIQLTYRVDHLSLFFAITAIGLGLLLALPWLMRPLAPSGRWPAWILLAQFGMLSCVLAGGLESMAAGWAMAVAGLILLVLLQQRVAPPLAMDGSASRWVAFQASAAVLLLAGAVAAETGAGTGAFDSIPVSAFDVRVEILLVAAPVVALLNLNLLCQAVRRPLSAAVAAASVVVPTSAYLLLRVYDLGGGRLPDARLNAVLVLAGGAAALGFAAASVWAVDLGAAVARLGQGAAGFALAAAGLGTGIGLTVLALAPISLGLGLAALLAVVEAGRGRLPSAPGGYRRLLVVAPWLLALGWGAGLPVGMELLVRLGTLRSGLDSGPTIASATLLAALALPLMVFAAYSCGRFGDGARPSAEAGLRLVLLALALPASGVALIFLAPTAAGLAAGALRVSLAEVQSSLGTVPPGVTAIAILSVLLLVAAIVAAAQTRLNLSAGLPGALETLPPRFAVVPGVTGIRIAGLVRSRLEAAVQLGRRHPVVSGVILWTAAVAGTNAILR
jgi:hypothetical protein